jgi:DNA-binding response OmpR family regulator
MWAPAEPVELDARTATLATRWLAATAARPSLDADGVLHAGDRSVALSPQRVALARLLVERFDQVVHHDELMSAGFSGPVRDGAVYLAIHRLRQRVAKVGLTIAPVRGRGFVLAWSPDPRPPAE